MTRVKRSFVTTHYAIFSKKVHYVEAKRKQKKVNESIQRKEGNACTGHEYEMSSISHGPKMRMGMMESGCSWLVLVHLLLFVRVQPTLLDSCPYPPNILLHVLPI